ncbi:MAG: polyribonucleotide nucleotidyltransferase, partial [Candidatus Jorgensenbacteria bacterium]
MNLERKIYKTKVDGEELSLEISGLAGKANGAVLARWGATAVLATVVMAPEDRPGDFFPLTVDYEERFYAAGKIIGSRFIRREGRPSDEATLSGRLIDRTIRPLFDERIRREIQVTVTILAYDEKHDPDVSALIAVSTALGISDVPWNGPVAGVRKAKNGEENFSYNAFFAGPAERVNMIEFEGREMKEEELIGMFNDSVREINKLIEFQSGIIKEVGKPKKEISFLEVDSRIRGLVREFVKSGLAKAVKEQTLGDLKHGLMDHLKGLSEPAEVLGLADIAFEDELDKFIKEEVLNHERRSDDRRLDEIRPLYGEVGIFERTHGSGLFIRGETQVLAITTLAPLSAGQLFETMESTGKKRFMLHYNFPNFSVGEVGRSRGPGRREIGHGALAAKALKAVLPSEEEFPYAIRVVAETLSSNGSTSMASTCAGSLSLMDAGVPLKKHVAGISVGIVLDESSGKYKLLTDIQGPEDHHGGMDFKVAGTHDGVTAVQMDVKMKGITAEIFEKTLRQAREAREEILSLMEKTIPAPRPQISSFAPTILTLNIKPESIGEVIGSGGRTINGIIDSVGNDTTIDIEDDGRVFIASFSRESAEKAFTIVSQIVREYGIGEIVEGPIVRILEVGAIVDLGGGRDGMIHVSELKDGFVKNVEDVVKIGDVVMAKVVRVENGRIALSL